MFEPLRNIFRSKPDPALPRVPEGERYYVIGDVHGCADQFSALIEAIERDDAEADSAKTTVVLLGDLIDRGPDSAGVVAAARDWQERRKVRILAGNHEEMFLRSFEDIEVLRHFLKFGGRETILSYGLKRKKYNKLSLEELFEEMGEIVPKADRKFIRAFEDMIVAGDYVFVHAGVDPRRSIEEQKIKDLRWIRDRFLSHEGSFSHVVVHGHTIFDEIEDCGMRIGIDTGAYQSGRLTALVLEGTGRRAIAAVENDGEIVIEHEEIRR
ncbi:metallophosphoesterase family protein [Altererythrobacter sp. MF3-039]|uniref:metallophosphoesterase family protein n=1 Tax=Altererythrobacter sp. MF3-039 TaxID=3252901 RepID=UPI00390CAB05